VQQRLFFDSAVNKIAFTPTPEGGLDINFSALTLAELFALGEAGTPEWPFLPESVKETLRASGWNGPRTFAANPRARPLIELERRKISGSLGDAEARKLAGAVHGSYVSQAGAVARKKIGAPIANKLKRDADLLRLNKPGITRGAAAHELAETLHKGARHIQNVFKTLYTEEEWPLKR